MPTPLLLLPLLSPPQETPQVPTDTQRPLTPDREGYAKLRTLQRPRPRTSTLFFTHFVLCFSLVENRLFAPRSRFPAHCSDAPD